MRRVEDLHVPRPPQHDEQPHEEAKEEKEKQEEDPGLVPVRLYLPTVGPVAEPLPLLVWLHGGGWVLGSVASYDQCCRRLAQWGNVAVLSIDYRRGPEHRYPCAVDDAEAAYVYAVTTLAQDTYPQARRHAHTPASD
jgi:acetyl esterase/lipase